MGQEGWNVPLQVPVSWTPLMVTVHGAPVIGTGGLAVGDGEAAGEGDAEGDADGDAEGEAEGEGAAEGEGTPAPSGVWLQMLTSWIVQPQQAKLSWAEKVTLVVPAGIGVQ